MKNYTITLILALTTLTACYSMNVADILARMQAEQPKQVPDIERKQTIYDIMESQPQRKLAEAIINNDIDLAQAALQEGAQINREVSCHNRWEEHLKPLTLAVSVYTQHESNHPMLALLINAGAEINSVSKFPSRTPLIAAAAYGHLNLIDMLFNLGALVDVPGTCSTALIGAAQGGEPACVQELIRRGAQLETFDSIGRNALLWACICNETLAIQELLLAGAHIDPKYFLARDESITDIDALIALKETHQFVIQEADVVLGALFDPTAMRLITAYTYGELPVGLKQAHKVLQEKLCTACKENDLTTVQAAIAKGADVNAKTEHGRTALMYAALRYEKYDFTKQACFPENKELIVQELIRAGAQVNVVDDAGNTPLTCAAHGIFRTSFTSGMAIGRLQEKATFTSLLHAGAYIELEKLQLIKDQAEIHQLIQEYRQAILAAIDATQTIAGTKKDVLPLIVDYVMSEPQAKNSEERKVAADASESDEESA